MKKPIMKKEDLDKEYFKVPIKLNDIYKIYRSDFEGMIEVAEHEAMSKYPKTDWRQIKLLVMQTMINPARILTTIGTIETIGIPKKTLKTH